MPRSPGRTGHRWRQARAAVLAGQPPCSICGGPIDYTARPRTRWSASVDHIVRLSDGGDPLDPRNLRAAHYGCNGSRGSRRRQQQQLDATHAHVSRPWR